MIQFEWSARFGILEAGCDTTDREWHWFRGDEFVTVSHDGQIVGSLSVPDGATALTVKRLIRDHSRGKVNMF